MNLAGIIAVMLGVAGMAASAVYVLLADRARRKRIQTGIEWASELGVLAIDEQRFLDAGVDFFNTPISLGRFCELARLPMP